MTLLRPGKGGIEGGPTVVANLLWPLLPTPNRLGFSRPFAHGAWLRGREARWLMAWDDHPLEKKKKTDFKHALRRDFLLVCREVVCCFDVYVYILYSFNISKRFFFKKIHSSRKSHHDLCKMNKWAPRFFGDRKVGKGRLLFLTSYDRHYRIILKGSYHQTVDKPRGMYSQANNKILD